MITLLAPSSAASALLCGQTGQTTGRLCILLMRNHVPDVGGFVSRMRYQLPQEIVSTPAGAAGLRFPTGFFL